MLVVSHLNDRVDLNIERFETQIAQIMEEQKSLLKKRLQAESRFIMQDIETLKEHVKMKIEPDIADIYS